MYTRVVGADHDQTVLQSTYLGVQLTLAGDPALGRPFIDLEYDFSNPLQLKDWEGRLVVKKSRKVYFGAHPSQKPKILEGALVADPSE